MRSKKIIPTFLLLLLISPKAVLAGAEELEFGCFVDRVKVATSTIVCNYELDKRIAEIGNKLAAVSGKPDVKYTVRVMNDPIINAHSAAGGFIYLNTGLLDILGSEDEVAAVMAHEVGHVANNHQINFVYAAHRKKVAGEVAGLVLGTALAVGGGMAVRSGYSPAAQKYHPSIVQQSTNQVMDLGLRLGGAVGNAMSISMIKGYGKRQELDADAFAVHLLKKAGYDPHALISVIKKLASIRNRFGLNEHNYTSHFINAEPGLEERMKTAEEAMLKTK